MCKTQFLYKLDWLLWSYGPWTLLNWTKTILFTSYTLLNWKTKKGGLGIVFVTKNWPLLLFELKRSIGCRSDYFLEKYMHANLKKNSSKICKTSLIPSKLC